MPNPNPIQTPEFVAQRFPAAMDISESVKLAKQPISVKLPIEIDQWLRSLEPAERSSWLRSAIQAKWETEAGDRD